MLRCLCGANTVTFVDNSKESLKICEFNLKSIKESANLVYSDALNFLKTTLKTFDIIYFDPPYVFDDIASVLSIVYDRKLLKENGLIIYEHKSDKPSLETKNLKLINTKKYGIAILDFYTY